MRKLGLLLLTLSLIPIVVGCGGGGGSSTSGLSDGKSAGGSAAYDQIPLSVSNGFGTDPATEARRYSIATADESTSSNFPSFKAANPNCRLLVYEMAAGTAEAVWKNDPIGNAWIGQNHPEWYLLDGSGQKIHFKDYPGIVAVDPGNTGYQQAWTTNAIAIAKSKGAAGVFMDNCNDRYDWNYSTAPAKYPTQASYGDAMDAFITYASARFRAEGLLLVGNVSGQTWDTGRLAGWIQLMDGFSIEPTPYGADGTPQEIDARWQHLFAGFQANPNKLFLQFMPGASVGEQSRRYAAACFLIWKGANSYLGTGAAPNQPIVRDPQLDVHIGQPVGDATNIGGKIYQRNYQNGVVYLNSSGSQSGSITLASGLKDYQANPYQPGPRTLGPHDSLILVKR